MRKETKALILSLIVYILPVLMATAQNIDEYKGHLSFKDVKRAAIVIKESYYKEGEKTVGNVVYTVPVKMEGVSFFSDILEMTQDVLKKYTHLQIATDQQESDFTVEVNVAGVALSVIYSDGRSHYAGASIKVIVLFKAADGSTVKGEHEYKMFPMGMIVEDKYLSPQDAPFLDVLPSALYKALFKAIYRAFGISPLVAALDDAYYVIRLSVVDTLGVIGNRCALKVLISSLKDNYDMVREEIARVLSMLTGQNFGTNYDLWQEWWQKNKDSYSE